jgi:aryl-alcohol dehydrogenase-like predicted oxidoreductase
MRVDKRRIGVLSVSVVGLGCNNFGWRLDDAESARVVRAAVDAGIDFFDTADLYGGTLSEEIVGRALAPVRERVAIATKFGWQLDEQRKGASPAYVRRAVEASLQRLGTDRIDLYQLHKPDPSVPIADTLGALDELVRAGKVREIGCSNFSAEQLRAADAAVAGGAARFVSVQNEYSLLQRTPEDEVLPACERLDLAFLPYFPLASGLLSGKYRKGVAPPQGTRLTTGSGGGDVLGARSLERVEALVHFATARGRTLLELAVSWLLSRRVVASVIAGATSPAQVRANAAAPGWALDATELAEVDRVLGAAGA